MWLIFSTPVLIRHPWQLRTVVFLHWCLITLKHYLYLYFYLEASVGPYLNVAHFFNTSVN